MVKKTPKTKSLLLLILLMALALSGCGAKGYQPPAPATAYTASGIVVDNDDNPLENVTILFSEPFKNKSVTTDAHGTWTQSGLYESVTVTPSLAGYEFNPSSQVITKATSGIKFTATIVPPYDATGTITIGQKPSTTVLDLTQVALNYEYPVGTPKTVYPEAGGNWQIEGITGTVTVTPILAGWEFVPASFELTAASDPVNFTVNRVYTGKQILDAIVADATLTQKATIEMPNTITIDGDNVSFASLLYLISKWVTLYTDGSSSVGATPTENIQYLEIEIPTAITKGKTSGYIRFGNATAGYYGKSVDLVSILEETKKVPDQIELIEGWNEGGAPGSGTTQTIDVPNFMNMVARCIKFTASNQNIANTSSIENVSKPASWVSVTVVE